MIDPGFAVGGMEEHIREVLLAQRRVFLRLYMAKVAVSPVAGRDSQRG